MKKIISFILVAATLLSMSSFLTYAEDTSNIQEKTESEILIEKETKETEAKTELQTQDFLSFSCHYDVETQKINVKGTMDHDAFALHGDSTLVIYAIPSGKTEMEVINDESSTPIAQAPVSITFAFSFKISSVVDRYSRYAIFIRSSDGEYILTTEAQYAEATVSSTTATDKSNFKGIAGNYSPYTSDVNSELVIIPVYLDSIFTNESNGYIYQIEKHQLFFNKAYINELDTQIRSLSLFDTKIYLQFLLRSNGAIKSYANEGAEYALPDVFDNDTILLLHSVTDFLVSRYTDNSHGKITGIVLGKQWDNSPRYNSFRDLSLEQYIRLCGQYTAIVANAMRDINSNIDIMLSFSGDGFFVNEENKSSNLPFSSKELLIGLLHYLDASTYSGISCSFLIEAEATPLDITAEDIEKGIDPTRELSKDRFHIGKQKFLSELLSELSTKYKSCTKYYSILWTPDKELKGNALCAAYSYAFYSLLFDENVTSFIIEFSNNAKNKDNAKELTFILKNIDTKNSYDSTQKLLAFFNKKSWLEVLGVSTIPNLEKKTYYTADVMASIPDNIVGEFYYFDFANAFLADNWNMGVGCSDVKIDYSLSGDKALRSDFSLTNRDFCDLIYTYEYSEKISYTPYIKFNFEINSERPYALYEIRFLFKSENAIFESSSIIKGNQANDIILNMSTAKDFSLLDGVKISVRSLDESVDNCTLWIYNITGYSKKYTADELKELIEKERNKQKNHDDSNDLTDTWQRMVFVAVVLIVAAFIGFALILILQKNSRAKRKE